LCIGAVAGSLAGIFVRLFVEGTGFDLLNLLKMIVIGIFSTFIVIFIWSGIFFVGYPVTDLIIGTTGAVIFLTVISTVQELF
jgi:hypothetical protein